MLTKLTRCVIRESSARFQGRPILVKLEEGGKLIRLKLKGLRRWYTCTVEQVFVAAARNAVQEDKLARQIAREERRRAKGR